MEGFKRGGELLNGPHARRQHGHLDGEGIAGHPAEVIGVWEQEREQQLSEFGRHLWRVRNGIEALRDAQSLRDHPASSHPDALCAFLKIFFNGSGDGDLNGEVILDRVDLETFPEVSGDLPNDDLRCVGVHSQP